MRTMASESDRTSAGVRGLCSRYRPAFHSVRAAIFFAVIARRSGRREQVQFVARFCLFHRAERFCPALHRFIAGADQKDGRSQLMGSCVRDCIVGESIGPETAKAITPALQFVHISACAIHQHARGLAGVSHDEDLIDSWCRDAELSGESIAAFGVAEVVGPRQH